MTLHWWMHWFWVTALLYLLLCSGGVEPAPQTEEGLHPVTAGIQPETLSVRQGRAMYYTKTPYTAPKTTLQPVNNTTRRNNATEPKPVIENTNKTEILNKTLIAVEPVNATEETKPLEVTQNKTVTNTTAVEITNNTDTNVTESHTTPEITENTTISEKRNETIISAEVKEIENNLEGASESRIVTEKPLSLETSFLQTRIPPSIESSKRVTDQSEFRGMDTGAIAGISFAALVVVALVGSTGFVLYRRRYLNKPQTLNDKCSNPDSSGYLDDSTIRDNSEEMYSLDNDSFLNSLEAMTIQNYWTDTVKHTKL